MSPSVSLIFQRFRIETDFMLFACGRLPCRWPLLQPPLPCVVGTAALLPMKLHPSASQSQLHPIPVLHSSLWMYTSHLSILLFSLLLAKPHLKLFPRLSNLTISLLSLKINLDMPCVMPQLIVVLVLPLKRTGKSKSKGMGNQKGDQSAQGWTWTNWGYIDVSLT